MRIFFLFLSSLFFYCHTLCGAGEWQSLTAKRNVRDTGFLQNKLWAACDGGVFTYNLSDSSFQEFSPAEGLTTTDLSAVCFDNNNAIWLGSSSGYLISYQPSISKWSYYQDIYSQQVPEKSINNLTVAGDTLLVSSDIGVSVFSINENRFDDTYEKFGTNPQISGHIRSVLIQNDTIWLATDNGIASAWRFKTNLVAPESWSVFKSANGLPADKVTNLSVFNNTIIASTYNGLALFTGAEWQVITATYSINTINSIATDDGFYFITTQKLYRLNPDYSVELINEFSGLNLTSIDFYNGKIFLGTSTKGIIQVSGSDFSYIIPPGPPINNFMGLAVDSEGDLWAGTGTISTNGFLRYDGKKWYQFNVDLYPELKMSTYYKVDVGYQNSKWVSGWGPGVALLNSQNQVIKVINKSNGLPPTLTSDTNYVVVAGVVTDKNGKAWINVRTGRGDTLLVVYKLDSTFEYIKSPYSFISTGIVIDQNSTKWLWTGSNGAGLYFYNETDTVRGMLFGSRWGKLTKSNGLLSDNISVVAVDNQGELWVGTTDAGINIIYESSNPVNRIALYYPLRDQNLKVNDILVDALNQKWIATSKGVYLFSPDGTSMLNKYDVENTDGKLLDDNVLSMAMNRQTGLIYFGTEKGISVLSTSAITPLNSFNQIKIYPNPYLIPSRNFDGALVKVHFDNLVENTTIKILTIDGILVKEIITPGGRVGEWDGKDTDGKYVSTGIYIVAAYSDNGNEVGLGKIAIIHK
jgi:ligand-binding sensor domain-containing protein